MNGETKKNYQLKPLTKTSKETGEIYYRRADVIAQILAVIELDEKELFEKISHLKSETLVFLVRERFQTNLEISGEIWEILSRNIWKIAVGQKSKFNNDADFEDFFSEIQMIMFEGLCNLESDAFDYAQVSFGEFVKGVILNKLRQKSIVREREKKTVWLDLEFENEEKTPLQLVAGMTNSEKELIIRQAFHQLPREVLEVCFLYYLEGWQIDSKETHKTTIAKVYGKSEKTIRNWLHKAQEILMDYRGEIR